jgi:hypothetical protein
MEKTLTHSGGNVQEFYAALPGPVRVGIKATGTMQWFLSPPGEWFTTGARPMESSRAMHDGVVTARLTYRSSAQ